MRTVSRVALLALVLLGAVTLNEQLEGLVQLAIWLPLAGAVALQLPPLPRWARAIGVIVGAVVVPVFALLGSDRLWAETFRTRIGPLWSWLIGAAAFGLYCWIYLGDWWVRPAVRWRAIWSTEVVFLVVLLPPPLVALVGAIEGDEHALTTPPEAVSKLDVVVLREGPGAPNPALRRLQGWTVRTWTGQVDGAHVSWGAEGPPPPGPEADADRVLLLMPKKDDVDRWLRLADTVAASATPTYAVLGTPDAARRARWHRALAGKPGDPSVRRGGVRSLQDVEGVRDTTDLALRLASQSPTADADLALAAKHRPLLLFDSHERYAVPLNVDRLLESGKMRLCDRGQGVRSLCSELTGSAGLHNGANHLMFDPEEVASITADSTIYVNVTRSGNDHGNTVYLDYWWYLPNNPTGDGDGALCGAGFVIAGVTCFDHQSDWEGVTVVLDADSPSSAPSAVSYAQHDGVVRYSWPALERLWAEGDGERFGHGVDARGRPLVFVAAGTHAAYPTSCSAKRCTVRAVPGIRGTKPLREASHDGGKRWPRDEAADCPAFCLTALPTRDEGRETARWNAFEGRWGTADCVLGVVCVSDDPPRSPGSQTRFRRPWCTNRSFGFANGRFRTLRAGCTGRRPSNEEILTHERLLALGDSFSSGEGGGDYDPDTNSGRDSCHRSPAAWPQRVALELNLAALPSLACSGATTRNVLDGVTDADEPERRVSQLTRIGGDPGVITLTIGGNDVGFAGVLRDCVIRVDTDCVTLYQRASGDVLEDRIHQLAKRLPQVYAAIRERAPRAKLVVMGYPRLFPKSDIDAVDNCGAWHEIEPAETRYLNALVPKLNGTIAAAAQVAGATYVDVTDAFDGQELRCSGPTYLNRLVLNKRQFKASFHPNARGYRRLGDVVAHKLAGT